MHYTENETLITDEKISKEMLITVEDPDMKEAILSHLKKVLQ